MDNFSILDASIDILVKNDKKYSHLKPWVKENKLRKRPTAPHNKTQYLSKIYQIICSKFGQTGVICLLSEIRFILF